MSQEIYLPQGERCRVDLADFAHVLLGTLEVSPDGRITLRPTAGGPARVDETFSPGGHFAHRTRRPWPVF